MNQYDERTLHRLEAFSDIIIGFCIAEMGLNLVVPKTAAQLPSIVAGTDGFVISFVLVSILWWIHHRIFKSFFVPNVATVITNFAMLGALVLMVYFQQICVHLIAIGDDVTVAVQLWAVSYSVVYALVGIMLWYGIYVRWSTLSADDLRWGLRRGVLVVVGTVIFIAYALIFRYRIHASELFLVLAAVILAARVATDGVIGRVVGHRVLPPRAKGT